MFEGIAADDWDAVVRYCKNFDEPGHKAADELSALSDADDDAYRLLPLRIQQRVVAELVAAGRLGENSRPENPLLRMSSAGTTALGAQRLLVHSRRHVEGEVLQYDSVLIIDDAGTVRLER